ncbi:hypothetical protein BaRGS_00022954 [Batillaria attramentaria]|uniref:Carboxylesterase type B domain-containing protein n=1 Tax=Batillaria attramentaria TaxID=370345 RepID=A0ABD0KF77_9CAEN
MASFRCALLLLLYSIVLKLNLCDCATPYAATKLGIIQGTQKLRPENNTYLAFQGIPYAKPPTAQRRWQLPEPFGYLGPVYEATAPKAACPQDGKGIEMSEDCLYLDVYVPGGSDVSGLHFNLTLAMENMENVPKRSEG